MEVRHLATFLAVVREGSFVRAAERLGYAQSTVTLHVQELESELGAPVIDRSSRRLVVTEAGRLLEAHAAALVRGMDDLRETVAGLATGGAGHVRLGAVEPAAGERLGPLLAGFCGDRPRVSLLLEVGGAQTLAARVATGELDAALSGPPARGQDLDFEPIFREPIGLLVPAGDALAAAAEVDPRDLLQTRLLTTEETCAYRQVTESALGDRGIRPALTIEIASLRALAHAVQAGLGTAVVPLAGVTPPPPGTVTRQVRGADLALTVGIVTRRRGVRSEALRALLEALREGLREGATGAPTAPAAAAART
jgi:LysR family transcriptional regulator, regulator of the ytmI operon